MIISSAQSVVVISYNGPHTTTSTAQTGSGQTIRNIPNAIQNTTK